MDILDAQNPLETVETILEAQEWQFERLSEDQILVEVSGQNGEYKLQLNWQAKNITASCLIFCVVKMKKRCIFTAKTITT